MSKQDKPKSNKKKYLIILATFLIFGCIMTFCAAGTDTSDNEPIAKASTEAIAAEVIEQLEPTAEPTRKPTAEVTIEPTAEIVEPEPTAEVASQPDDPVWMQFWSDGSWAHYLGTEDDPYTMNLMPMLTGCYENQDHLCDTWSGSELLNVFDVFEYEPPPSGDVIAHIEIQHDGTWSIIMLDPNEPYTAMMIKTSCTPNAPCSEDWKYKSGTLKVEYPPTQ